MKTVAIFVLGYRAISSLKDGSLTSIEAAARRIDDYQVRVVYLDNYSRDGSIQWLMENHPQIDLLLSPMNYQYCRGTNIGIQYCHRRYSPDYFILVDADNFAEPDAYSELLNFAEAHPGAGIVQPLVRSQSDPLMLYSCGHQFLPDGRCQPIQEIPEDESLLLDLPSCSISSTLVRSEVFDACGLLDPVYEMYFESSDLSFRARNAGFRCACHPKAVTYNEGTDGTGVDRFHNRYYFSRNKLIFWKIHDEIRFREVIRIQLETYRELQVAFDHSEFGLDSEREAVRRGIEDGLRITNDPQLLGRPRIRLNDFDKSAAIVIQDAR